jgi:hypothetical protein
MSLSQWILLRGLVQPVLLRFMSQPLPRGHAVAYWLRLYVTDRKVAGSRPGEVNDFYQFT